MVERRSSRPFIKAPPPWRLCCSALLTLSKRTSPRRGLTQPSVERHPDIQLRLMASHNVERRVHPWNFIQTYNSDFQQFTTWIGVLRSIPAQIIALAIRPLPPNSKNGSHFIQFMKVTFVELLQTATLLLPSDQLHTIRLSTPLNTTRQRQITPREILSRLLGVVNDNNLFLSNPIRVHLSKFYAIFCRALSVSSPSSRAFTLLEERWRHQAEQVGHFPVSSVHYCLG